MQSNQISFGLCYICGFNSILTTDHKNQDYNFEIRAWIRVYVLNQEIEKEKQTTKL